METLQFEPMSVGRIFDRAFAIYRNNFLRFITIVALIQVPLVLLSIASRSWVGTQTTTRQSTVFRQTTAQPDAGVQARRYEPSYERPSALGLVGQIFTVLLQLVGVMLCQAALIKSVSETYLGHEITVGQAYRFALPKAVTLVLATICVGLVIGLGFLLLVVPGVIFMLWFYLTTPAIVIEGRSATAGMGRSKALVAGNLGKAFAVGLLAFLIGLIVGLPLGYFAGFVGRTLFAENLVLRSLLIYFASTASQILVTPINAAAVILLYYDLRIRKEGFDLQMLAQSIDFRAGGVACDLVSFV